MIQAGAALLSSYWYGVAYRVARIDRQCKRTTLLADTLEAHYTLSPLANIGRTAAA
jgi:hypothetical protein